jgi:hypothetical protein
MLHREKTKAWRELAARIGLTFHPRGGSGIPDIGHITGTYRGRNIEVYARSAESESLSLEPDVSTCVVVALQQTTYGEMPLHCISTPGPHSRGIPGMQTFERATRIISQPETFARTVLAAPALRERLLRVHRATTIWVRKAWVELQQSSQRGIEQDSDYLLFLLDLSCELAEAVEAVEPVVATHPKRERPRKNLTPGLLALNIPARNAVEHVLRYADRADEIL